MKHLGPAIVLASAMLSASAAFAVYRSATHGTSMLRASARDACARGNVLRQNQRLILESLVQAGRVFEQSSRSPQVRAYYRQALPQLEAARTLAAAVDCARVVP